MRSAPLSRYALIGFLSVATVGLSNVACQYLNYPTQALTTPLSCPALLCPAIAYTHTAVGLAQVLFKSCKTIPVMLVGVCYLGKK